MNDYKVLEEQPELTFGQKLVGVQFNPSRNPKVDRVKELCAEVADIIFNENKILNVDNNVKYFALQHTYGEILNASMNAVKILTMD